MELRILNVQNKTEKLFMSHKSLTHESQVISEEVGENCPGLKLPIIILYHDTAIPVNRNFL